LDHLLSARHSDQTPPLVSQPPRVGMLARVRNRQGLISASEPFDGSEEGRFHLVTVEYLDGETPQEDQLIWEREVGTSLREPTALPNVSGDPAMGHVLSSGVNCRCDSPRIQTSESPLTS